ncbi:MULTISPECIES: biofilm/acid-resistance regulator YmgB/AriR [Pantoea]|uniref:biofilm/acid-resistance regulator YmgB/AriR n=1 Tax=Pantoea TaxID=53335 RepID=UPI0007DABA1B|nr:biofilm/acid-resistance regulator YmgB/AriR [Pantoea ananatis]MCW0331460.1 putative two-component-system connector protein AriR [Pantoea ananatis]MDS7722268.1 biofilm development regulator YmgB/AriR family protein [Pantoea ananatis]PZD67199.1 transcriptional regulator [Pantoea ananatis]UYL04185.1 biofilm development regulator YmgB/AriR family protein [Pantoea ananatis]
MQQSTSDLAIIEFFRSEGEHLAQETELLGRVIRNIVSDEKRVTNKAIILYLIAELESTDDEFQIELLRRTLEIVVGRTPDDAGV